MQIHIKQYIYSLNIFLENLANTLFFIEKLENKAASRNGVIPYGSLFAAGRKKTLPKPQ